MPDTNLPAAAPAPVTQSTDGTVSDAALLFGTPSSPPIWLWLTIEPAELAALELALLRHLRSPLFPSRIGTEAVHPGDDPGLLDFATRFGSICGRFAEGASLVLAATRIVAERGGPLACQGALACIEALQHRLHAEARGLAGDAGPAAPLRPGRPPLGRSLAALRPRHGAGPPAAVAAGRFHRSATEARTGWHPRRSSSPRPAAAPRCCSPSPRRTTAASGRATSR